MNEGFLKYIHPSSASATADRTEYCRSRPMKYLLWPYLATSTKSISSCYKGYNILKRLLWLCHGIVASQSCDSHGSIVSCRVLSEGSFSGDQVVVSSLDALSTVSLYHNIRGSLVGRTCVHFSSVSYNRLTTPTRYKYLRIS